MGYQIIFKEHPYAKSRSIRKHAAFNATQSDSCSLDFDYWSAFTFFDDARALRRNFRNTADVSDTLQSILGILKDSSKVKYEPQERGHFIHGPRVTIDVITFHKKKEFEHQILEAMGKPITFSTWLEDLVEQEEKKEQNKRYQHALDICQFDQFFPFGFVGAL